MITALDELGFENVGLKAADFVNPGGVKHPTVFDVGELFVRKERRR